MEECTEHPAKGDSVTDPAAQMKGKKGIPHLLSIYSLIGTMPLIYMCNLIKSSQQLLGGINW